jgi:hypothetical protein
VKRVCVELSLGCGIVSELTRGMNDGKYLDPLIVQPVNDPIIAHNDLSQFREPSLVHERSGRWKSSQSADGFPQSFDRALSVNSRIPRNVGVNGPKIRSS